MAGQGSDASSCEPERYIDGQFNSSALNNGVIDPCGLIAWSFFNDTYSIADSSGSAIPVDVRNFLLSYAIFPTSSDPCTYVATDIYALPARSLIA